MAFQHEGFWYRIDTLRDHRVLEEFYDNSYNLWLNPKNFLFK